MRMLRPKVGAVRPDLRHLAGREAVGALDKIRGDGVGMRVFRFAGVVKENLQASVIRNRNDFGVTPQSFERIIFARLRGKDMHKEIAVIEQNPLALIVAFGARRKLAVFLQLESDLIGDGLVLARTRARADHEVVGEAGNSGQVQNGNVGGFFFLGRADRDAPSGIGSFGMWNVCTSTMGVSDIGMRQKLAPIAIVL